MPSADPSTAGSINKTVHLEDARMRRRERGELATEGIAAVMLLSAAQDSHVRGDVNPFVILNVVAGAALALVVIRGIINVRRDRDVQQGGWSLVGVFGGVATITEGLHRLQTAQFIPGHKHFALGVLTTLVGVLTLVVGLFAERIERLRVLEVSDTGIRMRLSKFRRFNVRWDDVAEVRLSEREAQIITTTGASRVVPLARLVNRGEVREVLTAASHARNVTVTPQATG